MSANITSAGDVRQLDRRPEPDENITEASVKEPKQLLKSLLRLFRKVALLERRWRPRHIDFEDVTVDATGTTKYRFSHRFGGRVRYWPVEWYNVVGKTLFIGATPLAACLERHSDTDENTLVLVSHSEGKVTIRVEESG